MQLDHPHIVQLYVAFEDAYSIFLVQEYCGGGDLFEFLKRQGTQTLTEEDKGSQVLLPVLEALQYLHVRMVRAEACQRSWCPISWQ